MTSQIIEAAYRNFSLYTLEDRALLYFEDGLRASIRRGIWVSKNLPNQNCHRRWIYDAIASSW